MSKLTEEQLDLLKKLQPLFKEKMSERQVGDEYYNEDGQYIGYADISGSTARCDPLDGLVIIQI